MKSSRRILVIPLLILLLAAALRFDALARDVRFHSDEALFASFARSAAVQGDWLLHGPLDKPPLTIYADALAMNYFGITTLPNGVLTLDVHAGEFAARIPGTFASLLMVALIYALAKRLYGKQPLNRREQANGRDISRPYEVISDFRSAIHSGLDVPLIAMLLAALSPFALAFSATVFTDGLMLVFITFALWAACRGKALEAGITLALGFWCKQQALFYAPLVLVMLWNEGFRFRGELFYKRISRDTLLVALPLLIGVGLLFVWDGARAQTTSLWALALANNDPGRLARLDELLPRLQMGWQYAQYLFGTGWLTALGLILAVVGGLGAGRNRRASLILLAFVGVYFLFNWLIAFNIYDRYFLLLLPPLWLLAAQGLSRIFQIISARNISARRLAVAALIFGAGVSLVFAVQATQGQLPIGGDHGENAGIDQLGAYLNGKTLGAIIYDHWIGWELNYYLGTWSDKRKVYYPTPEALTADALLQPDPAPRYFVAPDDVPYQPWLDALSAAGFQETLDYDQPPFVVYKLIPPHPA